MYYCNKIENNVIDQCTLSEKVAKSLGWTETCEDVERGYDGKIYVKGFAPEKPAPTKEEQRQAREAAYTSEVDPITSHIQRLRDKEQTEEVVTEINELIAERDKKVQEIVEKYPYPVENLTNLE